MKSLAQLKTDRNFKVLMGMVGLGGLFVSSNPFISVIFLGVVLFGLTAINTQIKIFKFDQLLTSKLVEKKDE